MLAAALALGAMAPDALAAGSLTLTSTAAPTFSANLDSALDQTPTYTVPLSVADTRTGTTSAGWKLTITSTQLSTGSRTLATTASSITGVTYSCVSSCTVNPTNSVSFPVAVPAGVTPPTAVKFYNAAANTGRGTFTISPTVQVSVPANSYVGAYSSTLTITVASGP
jgi:WxL domain surface cell wall-binding